MTESNDQTFVWSFPSTVAGLIGIEAVYDSAVTLFDGDTLTGTSLYLPFAHGAIGYLAFVIDKASPNAEACLDFCESIKLDRSPLTIEQLVDRFVKGGYHFSVGFGVPDLLRLALAGATETELRQPAQAQPPSVLN